MKTILLGNAGSGKSTYSRALVAREPAARLSLDDVAFGEGAVRRPLGESVSAALTFIESHESWVIEGCYADIIEALLPHCERLIFLNPGVAACVEHCKQRPWEPEKYASPDAQDRGLEYLLEWVAAYEERDDEYGLRRHRALFDSFEGPKVEFTRAEDYAAASERLPWSSHRAL